MNHGRMPADTTDQPVRCSLRDGDGCPWLPPRVLAPTAARWRRPGGLFEPGGGGRTGRAAPGQSKEQARGVCWAAGRRARIRWDGRFDRPGLLCKWKWIPRPGLLGWREMTNSPAQHPTEQERSKPEPAVRNTSFFTLGARAM